MKTLRISDELHGKLTAVLGMLIAQSGKMQTYEDVIETLLNRSVVFPQDLLEQIEELIAGKKELGYASSEEFILDTVRLRLKNLSEENEH